MSYFNKCKKCDNSYVGPFCPICVQEEASRKMDQVKDPLEKGETFREMEVLEVLGRGGMGIVFKVRQPSLDRFLALKILPPEKAFAPEFPTRFEREAKLLASLSHPNIISVFDFGKEDDLYFFLMEYVEGKNLHDLIQEKKLTRAESIKIFLQICSGLEYAHSENVVHRDIKPANILLNPKGRVKVLDFGLAKLTNVDRKSLMLTRSDMSVGTLNYMAPEQMESSRDVDHRADIYSAGVVFYEMLTGELPLGRFDAPSSTGTADQRLDDIVFRALDKKPERRFQTVREMIDDLEGVTTTRPRPPSSGEKETERLVKKKTPPTAQESASGSRLKIPLLVGGVVISLVFGIAVMVYLGSRQAGPVDPPPKKDSPPEIIKEKTFIEEWKEKFASVQFDLDFSRHTEPRPGVVKTGRELLDSMPESALPEVVRWFDEQAEILPEKQWPRSSWVPRRKEAGIRLNWCRDLGILLQDRKGPFSSLRDKYSRAEILYSAVYFWRGMFTLKILVWPYATVKSLVVNNQQIIQGWKVRTRNVQVSTETLATPLVIHNIPVGMVKVMLTHPELGYRMIEIPEKDLVNGKTHLLSGRMEKKGSIQLRKAP